MTASTATAPSPRATSAACATSASAPPTLTAWSASSWPAPADYNYRRRTPRSATKRQLSTLRPAPIHDRLSLTAAPMSRASVGRARCILRAPGGPVDLDRHPAGGGSRVDQVKGGVRAGAGKQPRALADNHRVDEQGDLVDKLVVQQPADQAAAAVHLQLTRWLGFQLADVGRDVTGQDGRVRPPRFGERGRCGVLGPAVQRSADRARAHLGYRSPGAGEDLVGPPAEQERVGTLVDLVDIHRALVVVGEQRQGPSAALEPAPAVLIRPAESLHHAVDRDVRYGRQFHDRDSLLRGASLAGGLSPLLRTPL